MLAVGRSFHWDDGALDGLVVYGSGVGCGASQNTELNELPAVALLKHTSARERRPPLYEETSKASRAHESLARACAIWNLHWSC